METKTEIKLVEWFDDHFYKLKVEKKDVYNVDGSLQMEDIFIPSVTTKLQIVAKPFLARWRGDIGNREADLRLFEAQERGVRIHHAWYTITIGGVVIYQPWQRPNYSEGELKALEDEYSGNVATIRYQEEMFDVYKLMRWTELVKPKIKSSELIVYSLLNRDAGTADNVLEIEEGEYMINGSKPLKLASGTYIVDLKTGSQVDDNAYLQTACYAKCYEEMGLGEITGTLILHTQSKNRSAIEGLATHLRTKDEMDRDYQDYRLASALWERKNADAKPKIFEFPSLLTLKGTNGKDAK